VNCAWIEVRKAQISEAHCAISGGFRQIGPLAQRQ